MSLHLSTITPTMHVIARDIFSLGEQWYLAGGTALALQLGHRVSVDLDYFTTESFDTGQLKADLDRLWQNKQWQITYEAPHTLWCMVDGVQVSFISRPVPLLSPQRESDDFQLAAIADIAVMKLLAICSREEYKDYFDLACIATVSDVRQWVSWWQTAYPNQDMISWLVALSQVTELSVVPLEISEEFSSVTPTAILAKSIREIQSFTSKLE